MTGPEEAAARTKYLSETLQDRRIRAWERSFPTDRRYTEMQKMRKQKIGKGDTDLHNPATEVA